jgi:hypothetical protein
MQNQPIVSLLLAAAVALPAVALASGSYTARPPKPPVAGERGVKVDSTRYELGKRIYNGKLKLGDTQPVAAAAQEGRLRGLQARLPEREQKSTNLLALAGKLSAEQLDALEYYVNQRFPQK